MYRGCPVQCVQCSLVQCSTICSHASVDGFGQASKTARFMCSAAAVPWSWPPVNDLHYSVCSSATSRNNRQNCAQCAWLFPPATNLSQTSFAKNHSVCKIIDEKKSPARCRAPPTQNNHQYIQLLFPLGYYFHVRWWNIFLCTSGIKDSVSQRAARRVEKQNLQCNECIKGFTAWPIRGL